jgi:predicted permease
MSAILEAFNRVSSFFHKQHRDADLEAELQSHIDLAVEENLGRGMSPEEARRRALVRFGGVQQAKEQQRQARGLPWLEILLQDLRYTLRTLSRDRAFTLVAILILGLGIGANVVVFSVVNTVLLRPLPFRGPQQLVRILSKDIRGGESGSTYSADAMQQMQQRSKSFQEITGYFAFSSSENVKLISSGQPQPITGLMVAGNFFTMLGVQPILGRLFTPDECIHNARPVTLISYAFWKRQYAGNPNILGQAINLDGTPVTVIGVLPETFDFGAVFSPGAHEDLYTPAIMEDIREWGNTMALIGRLKPGITLPQAQAESDLLFPHLDFNVRHPEYGGDYTARLLTLKEFVSGKLRRSLIVLWCAVGMILLIVCVNLANLMLARAAARSKEFALRSALGAGRARLVRQLLTESLVLAGAGALLGLGLAFAVTSWLAHQSSIALPLLSSIRVDGAALGWTILIALVTGILFGLVPALKLSQGELQSTLKDGGNGISEGSRHDRLRSLLVISEVALACVLLVGAGLLLRSFVRVLDVDLGFEPTRAASISVDIPNGNDSAKRSVLWQDLIHRIDTLPGVETAGLTDNLPLSRNRSWGIYPKGREPRQGDLEPTFVYVVSPGYLNAIGMRLVKGRDIRWQDNSKDQAVVIINQTVADHLWPGQDPIDKLAIVAGKEARVIGVIADVRETNVETHAGSQMFLSVTAPQYGPSSPFLVVRTKLPPDQLSSSVMATLRQINPSQPATTFQPIQGLVDHAVSPRRFFVMLVSSFALLGLFLAALGIYGVISYSVTQRTQEIGIRMALGATLAQVQLGVIKATLLLALIGIALGTIISFATSRLIASLLFGTDPADPATFLAMVLILVTIALLAGYIPARRASRINPMIALRNN